MLSVLLLLPQPPSSLKSQSFVVMHTVLDRNSRLGHFTSDFGSPVSFHIYDGLIAAQLVCTQSAWLVQQSCSRLYHWLLQLLQLVLLPFKVYYTSPFPTAVDVVLLYSAETQCPVEILSVWKLTCFGGEWAICSQQKAMTCLMRVCLFHNTCTLSICAAQCVCYSTQALVICLPDGQGEIAGMLWQVGLILFCFPQF